MGGVTLDYVHARMLKCSQIGLQFPTMKVLSVYL